MKHLWKITVLLAFVWMFGLGFWALPQLPERLPVHWGFDGQPDRWGNKLEGKINLFLLPGVLSFAMLVLSGVSSIRKVEKDHVTPIVGVSVALLGVVTEYQIVTGSLGHAMSVGIESTLILVGLMFVLLGNVFPKIDPKLVNGFEHAKRSPLAWHTTMRTLSRAMMLLGLVFVALAFVRNETVVLTSIVLVVPSILIGVGLLEWKSFELWKTDPHRESPQTNKK